MEDLSKLAIRDAEQWFKSATLNKQAENFSKCVYSMEMAVEIALKAILILSGRDFPKRHDVFDMLEETVLGNPGKFSKEFIEKLPEIRRTFRVLLSSRAASGYGFDSQGKEEDFRNIVEHYYSASEQILLICKAQLESKK